MSNTPTEAHRKLATDLCRNVTGSNRALHHVSKFAQLIADSEEKHGAYCLQRVNDAENESAKLRAEVEHLKFLHQCESEAAVEAFARAERAEAELAAERARLDWLETPSGMDWQWEPERLTVSRAAIDAAMKEDAK